MTFEIELTADKPSAWKGTHYLHHVGETTVLDVVGGAYKDNANTFANKEDAKIGTE